MHESTQDAVWTYPSQGPHGIPCVCAEGWRQHGQVKVQERLSRVLMMAALGFMGYRPRFGCIARYVAYVILIRDTEGPALLETDTNKNFRVLTYALARIHNHSHRAQTRVRSFVAWHRSEERQRERCIRTLASPSFIHLCQVYNTGYKT